MQNSESPIPDNLTKREYDAEVESCRNLFVKKAADYGTAWRIMRPTSLTDQIFIKASRIRSLQVKGEACVDEGVGAELVGIVNYAAMALIQCKLGFADSADLSADEAVRLYDEQIKRAYRLMADKNHDYDEAWRHMRVSSITDIILMKIHRTKEIENHGGATIVSEGVEANYLDMINYAIFALILLTEESAK
ncbi:MAG: DUF1599 domain-containing protein [Marinilabiliaceae bacterium]